MKDVINKTFEKLLACPNLTLTTLNDEQLNISGNHNGNEIVVSATIIRPSLLRLCSSTDDHYLQVSVSASVNRAKAFETDLSAKDDIEFIRDHIYNVVKMIKVSS